MSNLGHIVICDEVFEAPDGDLIIKKPLGMITPISLPTNYTFVVSVGLINMKKEEKYSVEVLIESPTKKEVVKEVFEFNLDYVEGEDDTPLHSGGINVNFRNIELLEEGDYVIRAKLNEEEKKIILPVVSRQNK